MAKIELKNISKIFPNGVEAVKNVSFSAEDGEFIVLVGPSGCGKTTILRMIAGLEEITEGELLFDGKIVNNFEPKARNIGMVFQEYALYPHLTVFENIAFPLNILKKTDKSLSKEKIKNQVLEIAEQLELTQLLKRKPKELSGGQRQRVALGRAIIRQPNFFLFDEPLSNLDAKLRVLMRQEIISLQRKYGITSIYVTHDQTEAMTMGTKIAVMKDGVLQQFDTPFEIYNNPANIFVADFIGSPQINFFDGIFNETHFTENNSDFKIDNSSLNIAKKIKNHSKYILALRPENIKIGKNFDYGFVNFSTVVENVEFLGNELIIYFRTGNTSKRIKTFPNQDIKVGDLIDCHFNTNSLLFFSQNGKRM